jgi:hypothetical protein
MQIFPVVQELQRSSFFQLSSILGFCVIAFGKKRIKKKLLKRFFGHPSMEIQRKFIFRISLAELLVI